MIIIFEHKTNRNQALMRIDVTFKFHFMPAKVSLIQKDPLRFGNKSAVQRCIINLLLLYACPVNLKSPSTCTERPMITYYSPGISSVRWLRGYVCFGPLCIFLHAALRCTLQVKLRAVLIGVEVSFVR